MAKPGYKRYLKSRQWHGLCQAVRKRCNNVCESCHDWPVEQVHHLTYHRFGQEALDDLKGLCALCHLHTHQVSDRAITRELARRARLITKHKIRPHALRTRSPQIPHTDWSFRERLLANFNHQPHYLTR